MRLGPWLALALVACGLAACGPRRTAAAPHGNPITPPAGYAYDALADAQNARFALARGQIVPAENDLVRGVAAAKRLHDETASLFLADAPRPGSPEARTRLSEAEALTLLTDASAALTLGRADAADRALAALEAGVPQPLLPATLPLVRARESLDLAQEAMSSGRYPAMRAQLEAALAALQAYGGQAHAAEARALASTLSGLLADPKALDGLTLDRPALWRDQVQGWLPASLAPSPPPSL